MIEDKENNIEGLKNELDERKDVLDNVIKKLKEDEDNISEKKLETLKNIEKNRAVMDQISNILEKNKENQEK
jgi:sugar-specific transcriptional regulator TrmB